MVLRHRNGVFIAESTYEDRHLPKAARFRWNPEERVWWTTDATKAMGLVDYADPEAREILINSMEKKITAVDAKLIYSDPWFILDVEFEHKDLAKASGFRWFKRTNRWATKNPWTAFRCIKYATPAAKEHLEAWHKERQELLLLSRASTTEMDIPCPSDRDYYPYQKAGIAYVLKAGNTLIGDDMGLGKTVQAIGKINHTPAQEIRNVLIICPASLKFNWRSELIGDQRRQEQAAIFSGSGTGQQSIMSYLELAADPPKVNNGWLVHDHFQVGIADSKYFPSTPRPGKGRIAIINFDVLTSKRRNPETKKMEDLLREEIAEVNWDLLIVDEVHYCKNPEAHRTRAVFDVRSKQIIALSGTPFLNKIKELWPIIHWLKPEVFNHKSEWMERYAEAGFGNDGYYKADGAANLEELQEILRSVVMIRRKKMEVLTDLPNKRRQIIEIDDKNIIQNERALLAKNGDALSVFRANFREVMSASDNSEHYAEAVEQIQSNNPKKIESLAEIAKIRHETALAKLPHVIAHLKECVESLGKVVVFAHHRDVIHAIKQAFGAEAVIIMGGMSPEDKDKSVYRFQNDDSVKLFIGSITAAGVGLTLTAASHVVFAELDWVPGNMSQAEDRCHRIGQTSAVTVQHLVLKDSLDARIAATLVQKQEIIDRALDRKSTNEKPPVPVAAAEGVTDRKERSKHHRRAASLNRLADSHLWASESHGWASGLKNQKGGGVGFAEEKKSDK